MLNLDIMSFHRFAVKDAPRSDVTTLGRPKSANQWWAKAEANEEDVASFMGTACRNLVVRQMAVRMYLKP